MLAATPSVDAICGSYLEELDAIGPRLLLVGEAVSYRGGRLTGIPFVSETVMLCGIDLANGSHVLGSERGYRKADLSTRVSTEASATMVWGTIRDIEPLPLLWNAFPFHPFDAGNPLTNRMPTPAELEIGAPFVARLIPSLRNRTRRRDRQSGLIQPDAPRHPAREGPPSVARRQEPLRSRNGAPLAISARRERRFTRRRGDAEKDKFLTPRLRGSA